eukprot:scaffold53827_cov28-Tisochrysis_lutea.AAC.6
MPCALSSAPWLEPRKREQIDCITVTAPKTLAAAMPCTAASSRPLRMAPTPVERPSTEATPTRAFVQIELLGASSVVARLGRHRLALSMRFPLEGARLGRGDEPR